MTLQSDYAGLAAPTELVGTLAAGTGAGGVFALLDGTGYPTGALGIDFTVTMDPDSDSEEKIRCSLRSGNNFTIRSRGYDDTLAAVHTACQVRHTVDATILRIASAHVYDTTRDDHAQYARTDGTRVLTGPIKANGAALKDAGGAVVRVGIDASANVQLCAPMAIPTGAAGCILIASTGSGPSGNPVGGGVLFVDVGALKWKGPSGTVTTVGAA